VRSRDTERGDHDAALGTAPAGDDVVAQTKTATMVATMAAKPTRGYVVRLLVVPTDPVSFRRRVDTRSRVRTA